MIAIIDVSGTNLSSLSNAITSLGFEVILTHDELEIFNASHVILPGVGTASYGMSALKNYGLVDVIRSLNQPVLGICLGMQLLLEASEEGDVSCLGLIPGIAEQLQVQEGYPVPHMGWNKLHWTKSSPLKEELYKEEYAYFVHSFALKSSPYTTAQCHYKETFSAIINKDNFFGMQFHPEKSANLGLKLLYNFLSMEPSLC
ncbi:imidazole glycerol phosphate synthase subunit HisH [Legionella sp. km772]|uniref:imidazole glycerol phosphate synthase subunit HisH n=1 Tax=Legionella sp. km772 TaxID=2498111 RepID=UPI000F8F1363|nr:imidazole glycerol phosphate synthase subunit HisH [Legionella sp. km772]RUR12379.1 imidazole glycerol phosphate synthase subunit HisH [Legionella sp. km772]